MNFFKKIFSSTYEELWKAIIRPNRDNYRDRDLGPEKFSIKHKWYKRTDFSIINKRNLRLMCSFWEPFDEEREYPRLPCIIYLHGNSSSRCEVIPEIKYLLPKNITIFAFDFSGCGKSEGDYISLGWHEQDDVECVVNFLRKSNKVSTIGLWGRSMGAVTALMYGSRDLSIAGLVLDSPFSSLKILINELAKERVGLPDFIIKQALKLIKEIIKEKADFNLDDIEPKEYASKCFIPAYFCHSKGDTFVNIHHCKDLYNLYAGDKNIVYLKGNHNTERTKNFKDSVLAFFYKALRCKELKEKYEKEKFFDLKFNEENTNLFKNRTVINENNNKLYKMKNNSVSEIKISMRGRYDKNNSIDIIKNKRKIRTNIENEKNKLTKSTKSDNDIIFNLEDKISIKKDTECQNIKTSSNYIKYIHDINNSENINNKKLFGPSYNSSLLNRTPSKHVIDDDIFLKSDIDNKEKNEKKEEEIIQKILDLSKKEFEEISTNTPNFINNNYNKYNKNSLSYSKTGKTCNSKINKNNIANNKNILGNVNLTIPIELKHSLYSAETKTINNQNALRSFTKKANMVKNIKNRNRINKINNNNQINYNNNVFKNIINTKSNKNDKIALLSPYINNCPKPSPTKISFPELLLKFRKNSKNDVKSVNSQANVNNFNNISIHHIYNLKNKNNLKLKENIKIEEHKNIINNKRHGLLEKVIASPVNVHINGNINQIKKIQYINTTNNISTNNIIINNIIKKSESSSDNDSDTIINSKIENKKKDSQGFLEDEDNFFLEEDNIGINIPHS